MTYEWTASQRARLVPGATAMHPNLRKRMVVDEVSAGDAETAGVWFDVDEGRKPNGYMWAAEIDPSTLRPPTLAWLRKLARRKLGRHALILPPHGCVYAYRASGWPMLAAFYDGTHLDARSSCALWLSSLPEVP